MADSRFVLIYDAEAPFDGERPDASALKAISGAFTVIPFGASIPADAQVLVNLHGAYFPADMWVDICALTHRGMGFISLGNSTPLSRPCVKDASGQWIAQQVQTAYYTPFFIENSMDVPASRYDTLAMNPDMPVLDGCMDALAVCDTRSFIVQFTHADDQPGTCGSSGPLDAMIFPLVRGYNGDRHTASPIVMIDYYRMQMAGCRHIFCNFAASEHFWANGGVKLLDRLANYSACGAHQFMLQPNYATYYENERATLRLTSQHFTRETTADVKLTVEKDGSQVYEISITARFGREVKYTDVVLPFDIAAGYYAVHAEVSFDCGDKYVYHNAFWGRDEKLLADAPHVTAGRDYLLLDGQPLPIVGMTYMQSDLHRKFIFMPNPYIWNKDFGEMCAAGINMVRTGIWTGYREVMYIDSVPSEISMRAFEAMVHTACRYKMPLVLCLFSFIPPLWEGENSYLDPDSLRAQRRYVSAFMEKTHDCPLVSWDLINEPSVDNPGKLWSSRPNYDRFELAAWREYLKNQHGSIDALRENWNYTVSQAADFDSLPLPEELAFTDRYPAFPRVPMQPAQDFHRFATAIFNSWTDEMTRGIRGSGNNQLITVGQDEPFGGKKPNPLNMADHLDYVCNHSWWLLDDIYMDGVFCKPENKPCLIQETGIMYTQRPDNINRRSFDECRNILERKYALAFGSGCAGAVHWVWNTNNYMFDINESHIGAATSCGAQKSEADVSYDFGGFMRKASKYFAGRKPEKLAVVTPFSNLHSAHNSCLTLCGRIARTLGYDMHVPFQALSEYEISAESDYDVIIVPAAEVLCDSAFAALTALAEKGTRVIMSGVFWKDEYFRVKRDRFAAWGFGEMGVTSIQREEKVRLGGKTRRASYGGDSLAYVDKAVLPGGGNGVFINNIGERGGSIIWCSIPVELGEGLARDFYEYALSQANYALPITESSDTRGVFINRLRFENSTLYVVVNEGGSDEPVQFADNEAKRAFGVNVPAGRAAMFLCGAGGEIVASYRNMPISVNKV